MKKLIIGIMFFSLMLSGCSLIPMPKISRPKNVTVTSKSQNEELYKETGYEEVAGKARKYTRYYKDSNKNQEKSVPKKTLMEKVGSWISGLSFLAFILIGAGLFFFPTITIGILWSAKQSVGRALRSTVQAIKDVKADEQKELHDALKARHTAESNKVINSMKAEL